MGSTTVFNIKNHVYIKVLVLKPADYDLGFAQFISFSTAKPKR
jgi:hypothetical protein